MLTLEQDEEKRSRLWLFVTIFATALVLVVAVYFLYDGFFGNPLEGRWRAEDGMTLDIRKDGVAVLTSEESFPEGTLKVDMEYTLRTREKQIAFRVDQEEVAEAAGDLGETVTEQEVETVVEPLLDSFNYSLEGQKLALNEWDFGEQLLFTKIR